MFGIYYQISNNKKGFVNVDHVDQNCLLMFGDSCDNRSSWSRP